MIGGGLWNVRMRASVTTDKDQRHLSGAERIVDDAHVASCVAELLSRGRDKGPDSLQLTLEAVPAGVVHRTACLPVQTVHASDCAQAADFAAEMLVREGVGLSVAISALQALRNGINDQGVSMRGASLWDAATGRRLEPDTARGVRTSRFDYSTVGADGIFAALTSAGLTHYRTREALAVATKTQWSGVVAELCWSDEPDYNTGYIATRKIGYVRIPGFKPAGACGGRIFFVDLRTTGIDELIGRLESEYVLIDGPVKIAGTVAIEQYLTSNE